jgi:acetyltransferase
MFASFTGGVCGMFADLAEPAKADLIPLAAELRTRLSELTGLPAGAVQNPFDATTEGLPHARGIVEAIQASGNYDALLMNSDPPRNDDETARYESVVGELRAVQDRGLFVASYGAAHRDPNEFGVRTALRLGVPYLQGTTGVRALSNAQRYGEWQARRREAAPTPDPERKARIHELIGGESGSLSERTSKAILAEYDIPITFERVVTSGAEAAAVAAEIGFPVVLKVVSPDIPHKSEAGGVLLDLKDAEAVRAGYTQIVANVRSYKPDASLQGVLVSEMVVGATEFFVGVTSDPAIGPIVVAGLGGIYIEVFKDAVTAVPPVTAAQAGELIQGLQSAPLLNGARGRAPLDSAAFADVIAKVSQLAVENGGLIREVDINPLLVLPNGRGVRAADALMIAQPKEPAHV